MAAFWAPIMMKFKDIETFQVSKLKAFLRPGHLTKYRVIPFPKAIFCISE